LHDGSFGDLTRPRTLGDMLDAATAAEEAPRRRRTYGGPSANAADVVQRALHAPHDERPVLDGWTGRPITALPAGDSPSKRAVSVTRRPAATVVIVRGRAIVAPMPGEQLVEVDVPAAAADDHLKTPEEAAAERARRDFEDGEGADTPEQRAAARAAWESLPPAERTRRDAVAIVDAARGVRVSGPKRNDRGPRKKGSGGENIADEHWDHERAVGRPRKGKDVREKFSVRAEPATRATIAQTGRNESDFLAEAAKLVAMARTGAQADELLSAIAALTGVHVDERAAS